MLIIRIANNNMKERKLKITYEFPPDNVLTNCYR